MALQNLPNWKYLKKCKELSKLRIKERLDEHPIGAMEQDVLELEWIIERFIKKQPSIVVEIGSLYGGTCWVWLQYLKPGSTLVSIDPDPQFTIKQLKLWATEGVKCHLIKGYSTDANVIEEVNSITDSNIDWLFIDGDHSYEGCLADFENYEPLVSKSGYIVMHDVVNISVPGPGLVFQEKIKLPQFSNEVFTNTPAGIGVIKRV